jgi:HK97 family phage major capsid protein
MAEKWKRYFSMNKAKEKDDEAEILIYESIGEGWFEDGIGAKEFAKELKALGDIKNLTVRINSPGGSVFEGQAIYSQLQSHEAQITVHIDGIAASIASVIAMAGDLIIMPKNATMMIHDPMGMAMGNAEDMRKMAEALDIIKLGIIAAYRDKTGMEDKEISKLMSEETWMTADDAVSKGFADEIDEPVKAAASFDLSMFKNVKLVNQVVEPVPKVVIPIIKNKKEVNKMGNKLTCPECFTELINDQCPKCTMEAERKAAGKQARLAEIDRAKALRAVGKEFKAEHLAEHAISEGWTEDQLRIEILARVKKTPAGPVFTVEPAHGGKPFRNLGEQLKAVVNAARNPGKSDNRLFEIIDAATGAGETLPSDGGFLVQSDFTTELLARTNEVEILAPRCYHIPITGNGIEAPIIDESDRATGSRWGGVQIYRVAEAGTATKKKPKFAKLEMKLEKLMGLFYATDELLSDAAALESIVTRAFTEEFAFTVDDEIINGSGSGEMLGILNAGCIVSQTKETGQLAATIVAENIMKMYARMPARLIPGAEWYINQEVWPQLFQMQLTIGTGGAPLFMPPGGMSVAPYGTLMGRPIVPIEQAAALGTVGDILFANLKQYAIIEKGGLNAAQSIHVQFLTDENTFRWTARNNGQPIWKSAITPYKGSATMSPFIVLASRS